MDELENPNEDLGLWDMNLPGPLSGGGARQDLWNKQGDVAALVGADSKSDGGGGAEVLRVARRKMRRKGRKMERPVGLIYNKAEDK